MCGRYVSPEQAEIERAWHIGRHNNNPFRRRYNVLPTTDVPVCFAGLMSTWTPKDVEPRLTCAILTRAPSPSAPGIHDRMPVILVEAAHREWLDPEVKNAAKVAEIIATQTLDKVKVHPVSPRLNASKSDGEDLIQPIDEPG